MRPFVKLLQPLELQTCPQGTAHHGQSARLQNGLARRGGDKCRGDAAFRQNFTATCFYSQHCLQCLSNTIDSFIIYNLFLYSPKLVVVGKIDERRIVRISPNFLCTLPMDVAWFFSGVIPHPHGNILCTSGLVDDVILSGK